MNQPSIQGLYVITDPSLSSNETIIADVEQALKGGATIVQFRDKASSEEIKLAIANQLRALCHRHHATFIINDSISLAKTCQADGVHIGKDDDDIELARQQLGENAIIGVSCYNDIERAMEMASRGADYVAFGRFFTSKTKPDAPAADINTLTIAKQVLPVPVVAIGGIDQQNASRLIDAGADSIAVIQGVFAQENIEESAQSLASLF